MIRLRSWLGPLGDTEYAEDLCITGEVVDHRRRLGRTPPCRHRHRQGLCSCLDVQPVPWIDAQRWEGRVGALRTVGDLIVSEKPPVRGPRHQGQRGLIDGVTLLVAVYLKMNFSILQKWLNSVVICLFCVEINRAPKIMKIFVWPLWDVKYLGKILNVTFRYILNVIKIAQLN